MLIRNLILPAAVIAQALITQPASSQSYPSRPIRIITSGAGGGSDFDSRVIAQGISGPLGQPVIVDNQRSAPISLDMGARMAADGYNLLVVGESLWQLPFFQKDVTYDALRDFALISIIEVSPNVVAVHPTVPATSIKDLIALAKAKPGQLNYASSGAGGAPYLAAELFKSMAGVNITHIPYKASGPALNGLLGGEVDLLISSPNLIMPQARIGKLRVLAVTSAVPSALLPDLPTVASSGLPGYEATGVTGIVAPIHTPAAILNRLNQEVVKLLSRQDIKEIFLNAGTEAVGSSSEEYTAKVKASIPRIAKLVKDAGIKPN